MIAAGTCLSFLVECLIGDIHHADDVYKMALYAASADLSSETTRYTTAGEITAPAYEAGGAVLSGRRVGMKNGAVQLTFDDQVWPLTAGKMTARGCLVYNASQQNRAVCVGDFGEDIVASNAPFTAHCPPQGCVTITPKEMESQ